MKMPVQASHVESITCVGIFSREGADGVKTTGRTLRARDTLWSRRSQACIETSRARTERAPWPSAAGRARTVWVSSASTSLCGAQWVTAVFTATPDTIVRNNPLPYGFFRSRLEADEFSQQKPAAIGTSHRCRARHSSGDLDAGGGDRPGSPRRTRQRQPLHHDAEDDAVDDRKGAAHSERAFRIACISGQGP